MMMTITLKVIDKLTEDGILQPYLSDQDFRSTKVNAAGEAGADIGYSLNIFDLRNQKHVECAQPVKVDFNILENVPAGTYSYPLVLTNKLLSRGSEGQKHFNFF